MQILSPPQRLPLGIPIKIAIGLCGGKRCRSRRMLFTEAESQGQSAREALPLIKYFLY